MIAFLIIIIVLLLLGVLGSVIKGVLWLALIGGIVTVAVMAFGWFRLQASGR